MIRFTPIASSSAGNAYLASDSEETLAIECGLPWRKLQRALNFQVTSLSGVLVSHQHGDHARAVAEVMRAGVNIYSQAATLDALGATGHRAHPIAPRQTTQVGAFRVTPFELVHDCPCLGFYLVGPSGDSLAYVSDSAYCPVRFPAAGTIAVEANYSLEILRARLDSGELSADQFKRTVGNHLSLEHAIDLLESNDLGRTRAIWLLHLSDGNSDEAAFTDAVRRATGRPTYAAPAQAGGK